MRGGGHAPSRTNFADAFTGAMGGLICIFVLLWLTNFTDSPWLMASLGGSCVLVFVVWNAPLSQPRNIIGGHFISAFIGLTMYSLLGSNMLSISLGVGLTIFLWPFRCHTSSSRRKSYNYYFRRLRLELFTNPCINWRSHNCVFRVVDK